MLCPHEPEASDRGAHPQGDEFFCNSGCLLMDFQKGSRSLGFEETNQPSRAGFCSLPTQEVLVELPVHWAQLSCIQAPVSITLPALVALLCDCRFRRVAVLPCWDLRHSAAQPSKYQNSMATLVQAEELLSNSTKLCGYICKTP